MVKGGISKQSFQNEKIILIKVDEVSQTYGGKSDSS